MDPFFLTDLQTLILGEAAGIFLWVVSDVDKRKKWKPKAALPSEKSFQKP
jgi:hypothetical protein